MPSVAFVRHVGHISDAHEDLEEELCLWGISVEGFALYDRHIVHILRIIGFLRQIQLRGPIQRMGEL